MWCIRIKFANAGLYKTLLRSRFWNLNSNSKFSWLLIIIVHTTAVDLVGLLRFFDMFRGLSDFMLELISQFYQNPFLSCVLSGIMSVIGCLGYGLNACASVCHYKKVEIEVFTVVKIRLCSSWVWLICIILGGDLLTFWRNSENMQK
jgi:hypothetical protein